MSISFTEFMRPSGRKVERRLTVDDETEALAKELTEAGCRFTAELLPDVDMVSIVVENDNEDIACRVFKNNAERLVEETKILVRSAHATVLGDS